MKIYRVIVATSIFIVLLAATHYIHISYFRVNVVFYAAIGDGVIATLLGAIFLYVVPYFNSLGSLEKAELIIIWLLAGYAFAISIPAVVDRSLSFYILEKLQQRGGGIRKERIKDVFINEYLPEHRLVDVRLTEQLESGTIIINQNGCVKLTSKGQRIAAFGRFYRQHFLPKKRLLMGTYSDDLTDPFRNGTDHEDYECK